MTPEQRAELVAIIAPAIDDKTFDVDQWVDRWSRCHVGALGLKMPSEFASTPDGLERVKQVLACALSGGYL